MCTSETLSLAGDYKHPFKRSRKKAGRFFQQTIDPKGMAKAIRQVNYILALGVLREHETLQNQIDNLENSFFWLNELAEVLNPYLSLE